MPVHCADVPSPAAQHTTQRAADSAIASDLMQVFMFFGSRQSSKQHGRASTTALAHDQYGFRRSSRPVTEP